MKSISTGGGRVALLTVSPESSYVAVYDNSAHMMFGFQRTNSGHSAIAWMTLSENGNVLVLLEEMETAWTWKGTIFELDSDRRVDVPCGSPLMPSPHGRFFVPEYDDELRPAYAVYDSLGAPIYLPINPRGNWRASFVSDSVLATVTRDSLWLVNVRSGQTVSAQSFGDGMFDAAPNLKSGGFPHLLAVYDYHSLGLYTDVGKQIWHDGFGNCLGGVTFDPNGGIVVVQLFHLETRDGYLEYIDLNDPEGRRRSASLATIDNCIYRSDDISWLRDGLYLFLTPVTAAMFDINDYQDYKTVLVDFGEADVTVPESAVLHGIVMPVSDRADAALLHLVDRRHLALTQMPARMR